MKVRALLWVAILGLAGCATTASDTATITVPRLPAWRAPANATPIPWIDVGIEVARLAPKAELATSDTVYTPLNRDFAVELIAWTRAFIDAEERTHRGLHFTPESFDCDKFAKAFTLAAELAAGRAGIRAQPLAARVFVHQVASFGGVAAAAPPNDGHAVVALAVDSPSGLEILLVEPQSGAYAPLEQYPNRATAWRVTIGG